MLLTKHEEVTKQGFCKILWRKLRLQGTYSLNWVGWGWVLIWVWLGGGGGGRLFEVGRLLTFSAFRMGAYSRWALIRGWALIRINTVVFVFVSQWTKTKEESWQTKHESIVRRTLNCMLQPFSEMRATPDTKNYW